jgi:hypothetical protein
MELLKADVKEQLKIIATGLKVGFFAVCMQGGGQVFLLKPCLSIGFYPIGGECALIGSSVGIFCLP